MLDSVSAAAAASPDSIKTFVLDAQGQPQEVRVLRHKPANSNHREIFDVQRVDGERLAYRWYGFLTFEERAVVFPHQICSAENITEAGEILRNKDANYRAEEQARIRSRRRSARAAASL